MRCAFEGCQQEKSPKAGYGLCLFHYGQKRRGKPLSLTPHKLKHSPGQLCGYAGCSRPVNARGLCKTHYSQQYSGKALRPAKLRPRRPKGAKCDVATCQEKRHSINWCRPHYHVWRAFRLDPQLYEDMLVAQGGVCAICGQKCASHRRLSVDHDHFTAQIRGLLCAACNRGIGLLKDSPEVVGRALEYLRAFDASIRKVA
jgi:hypothetical protein